MLGYCNSAACALDLWAPSLNRTKKDNTAFSMYTSTFELAAREIVRTGANDAQSQYDICASFGLYLDTLTRDELAHLDSLIQELS